MVGAGKAEGAIDAGNMLKPALARGELHCIGATTLDEYRKYIEKDAALERRFQKILVGEPSVEATIAILRGLQEKYEVAPRRRDHRPGDRRRGRAEPPLHHRPLPARQGDRPDRRGRVQDQDRDRLQARGDGQARPPPDPAADRARGGRQGEGRGLEQAPARPDRGRDRPRRSARSPTSRRSGRPRRPPRRARRSCIEEIDRIALPDRGAQAQGRLQQGRRAAVRQAAGAREEAEGRAGQGGRRRAPTSGRPQLLRTTVGAEEIAEVVARATGIPVSKLMQGERDKLLQMEAKLHERVSARTRRSPRSPTRSAARARACPTRTGRPARSCSSARPASARPSCARRSPSFLFDSEDHLIRLDMSEFMEKHSVAAPDRRAAGLRRLRRRRLPDRGGAPQAVQRAAARRGREGAPRRLQRAAAGARRRPPDRRAGPHGRLQEHGDRDDLEPRLAPDHADGRAAASRRSATRSGSRSRSTSGPSS